MENISKAIRALFTGIDGDEILKQAGFYNSNNTCSFHYDTEIKESEIIKKLLPIDTKSSIDQIFMLTQIIQFKWMVADDSCIKMKFCQHDSVYNTLLHFSSQCLLLKDSEPLCIYHYLLRWHSLTILIGEDLITTSFLASRDSILKKERKSFDWDAFIGHDCKELNYIFEKPMNELHMHLKGSSYNVDLSWLCMMNNIGRMRSNFDIQHNNAYYSISDTNIYGKIKRAAAIRYYLAGVVECVSEKITSYQLKEILEDKYYCVYNNSEHKKDEEYKFIQDVIDKQYEKTKKLSKEQFNRLKNNQHFDDELNDEDIVDYILISHYGDEPIENKVLASERKLMYKLFKLIYEDTENERADISTLFYAYLSYKEYFRSEILQLNGRVGFANFANYEARKTDYILDSYNHLLYKAAIEGFLEKGKTKKDVSKRFIEARIVPKTSVEEIKSSLNDISKEIDSKYDDHYDFIFHFIKKREKPLPNQNYRHYTLREEIKKQAYAIYEFRSNENNWEYNNLVGKIVGLDAANSEIYCRPEVYAQAFRFLRGHDIKSNANFDDCPNDLNITYHVGEDFMDLADGLRAVEEAIIFLNLKNGDRLGHALALGTNVRDYYRKIYNTICASKQVILDNLSWLHHKCIRLNGYTPICGWLEIMFHKYFNEIFRPINTRNQDIIDTIFNGKDDIGLSDNIDDYYLSWILRGDSPIIGVELDKETLDKKTLKDKQWAYAGINHYILAEAALRNEKARELFDAYHSFKYFDNGAKGDALTIPEKYQEEWYDLLEKIQQNLLDKVERKHIAIECNPSSNLKIGEMERYDEHPIVKFFNYGISTKYPHHNIAVSINTDDQGVFSTSLEREYSLIALAVERNQTDKNKNSPRAIIDWLDRIREMSIEQTFKYKI